MKLSRLLSCVFLLSTLLLVACADNEKPVLIATATPGPNTPTASAPATVTAAPTSTMAVPTTQPPTPTPPVDKDTILATLDPAKPGNDISPYIYGLAAGDDSDPNYFTDIKPGLLRWGGNPATRFNWVLGNAWNAGRDYEFRNGDYGNPGKNVADDFVQTGVQYKIPTLITIPTIGWVAKNTDNNTQSLNVPAHGGPPVKAGSNAIAGYDPTANQKLTSVLSLPRKNAPFAYPPDPKSQTVYQDEWVANLVKKFGPASTGGVKFYSMDNEPDLWSETHTDVHPARMGYDDVLKEFVDYASAVKDVDPSALITGPTSWGWTGYFYSDLDRGSDNFKTAADRAKHGNVPFLPWFLDQLKQYEQKNGKRILDVLDVHYYPQGDGVYGGTTDDKTNALRLRSTRSLWDNNYIDESWINQQVRLIPRLKEWVDTYYPGTKIAISEWNWGADTTLNGALAITQVLGAFGREGLYMAAYWRNPPANSPGFSAFKMYTNFDGKGSTFGDKSVPVTLSDDQKVNVFAALDSSTGHLRLIMVNTQTDKEQKIEVRFPTALPAQSASVYELSAQTNNTLTAKSPLDISGGTSLRVTIPAYSATLIDLGKISGS
ncbi:MAG: hypothetical protein J0I20_34400 [Chloroflexi bacterium]|nr:hypothetical protein [Chloroflexota bacterium]OJV91093.1 MAG: hypothetical protein BGO39_26230 [Chloroflexi bacterium 54-19]